MIDLDKIIERARSLGMKAEVKESTYGGGRWISVANDDFTIAVFADGQNHICTVQAQMKHGESVNECAARLVKTSHDAAATFNLIMEGFSAARSVIPFSASSSEEIPF